MATPHADPLIPSPADTTPTQPDSAPAPQLSADASWMSLSDGSVLPLAPPRRPASSGPPLGSVDINIAAQVSMRRRMLLEKVLVCLTDADRLYVSERCFLAASAGAQAAEEESKSGQRPYRFMSKSSKKQLQEGVTSFCQIVAKSHAAELCLDAAGSFEGTSRGTEWKKAKNIKHDGEGGNGNEVEPATAPPMPEEYADVPVPVLPSDAAPETEETGDFPSDFLAISEADDITTALLKSAATAYRSTEDKEEKRRLLSIVAPHLNSKQGETLFGCTHHLWEAARHHARQHGPYGRAEPIQIRRTRTGKELEELVEAFWRQPQYCQEIEGRVLLRPGLKLKQVWDEFQIAYPDNVSLGSASVGDKTRIGRTAFLRRIPADLKSETPTGTAAATVTASDEVEGTDVAVHSDDPGTTASKRPVKKRKQAKEESTATMV